MCRRAADFEGRGSTPPGVIHISKRTSVGLPQKLCFCGKEEAPADKVKHFRAGNASNKAACRRRRGASWGKLVIFCCILFIFC